MIWHWVTTSPNPRRPATGHDAGQRGWKLHAVRAHEDARFSDIRARPAACGLVPRHGWGMDAFIEDRCERCVAAILKAALCDLETTPDASP